MTPTQKARASTPPETMMPIRIPGLRLSQPCLRSGSSLDMPSAPADEEADVIDVSSAPVATATAMTDTVRVACGCIRRPRSQLIITAAMVPDAKSERQPRSLPVL